MIGFFRWIVFGIQIISVVTSTALAQDRQITRAELWAYLSRSEQATKAIPFREQITGETSEFPVGPWKPYYASVKESVLPDRYHTFDAGRPSAETIQIGQVRYFKEGDGLWSRSEPGAPGVTHPARMPYFRDFNCRVGAENDSTIVTCVTKSKPTTDGDKDKNTNTFWFDGRGIFFKRESVVFNSRNWSRQLVHYEYDPSIRIEASVK